MSTKEVHRPKSRLKKRPSKKDNIRVVVRIRPKNKSEQDKTENVRVVGMNQAVLDHGKSGPDKQKRFTYDRVCGPDTTQERIFREEITPIVSQVLQGFNCTVFAYGQTGTGKTYTMEGDIGAGGAITPKSGIIPRAVDYIFRKLTSGGNEAEIPDVKVSFLEIYNEQLHDLLGGENGCSGSDLRIFEEQNNSLNKRGVVVKGLSEKTVRNSQEIFTVLREAMKGRQVAATKLNAESSRSHCLFSLTITFKEVQADGEDIIKTGTLNLVDLAGAENIGRSGAKGERATEAANINKSLLTLGRVITALVEKTGHIPYRDSKLTRLLRESLGGRAKTVLIAAVGPASTPDETLSTLQYAHRTSRIENKPEVNETVTAKGFLKKLQRQIEMYKADLTAQRSGDGGITISEERFTQMEKDLAQRAETIASIEQKLETAQKDLQRLSDVLTSTEQSLEQTTDQRNQLDADLTQTRVSLDEAKQSLDQTKTRLNEQVYITEQTKATEKDLASKASTLKRKLEHTIGDNSGLFDKIDRKAAVEQANRQLTADYHHKQHQNVELFERRLEEFRRQQQHKYESLSADVAAFKTAKESEVSALTAQIQHIEQHLGQAQAQISKSVSAHVQQSSGVLSGIAQAQQQVHQNLEQRAQVAQQQASEAADRIKQRLSGQKAQLTSLAEHMQQEMAASGEAVAQFVQQQIAGLGQVDSQVQTLQTQQVSTLSSVSSSVESMLAAQSEQAQSLATNVISSVQQMMNTFLANQKQQTAAALSTISGPLSQAKQDTETRCEQVIEITSQQRLAISQFQQQNQSQRDGALGHVTSEANAMVTSTEETTSSVASQLDQMNTNQSALIAASQSHLSHIQTTTQSQLQHTSTFQSSHIEHQNQTQSTVHQDCESLNGKVAEYQTQDVSRLGGFKGGLDEQWANVGEFTTAAGSSLETVRNTAAGLRQQFQSDVPTGQTPHKQSIEYPRSFKRTRPDDDLRREFHHTQPATFSALGLDDSITQDNDETTDGDNDHNMSDALNTSTASSSSSSSIIRPKAKLTTTTTPSREGENQPLNQTPQAVDKNARVTRSQSGVRTPLADVHDN